MQQHCNDNLSGEALMMIKEHFIERYGVAGVDDGLRRIGRRNPAAAHRAELPRPARRHPAQPDLSRTRSSVRPGVTDCRLLTQLLQDRSRDVDAGEADGGRRLHAQAPAAPGTARSSTSSSPPTRAAAAFPAELVYDPVKNPKGARCTMWDTNVATFGRDPLTGFARRSLDNVGVQYGLEALNRGAITKAEFLDLNDKIGGFDNDGQVRAPSGASPIPNRCG